MCGRFSQVQTRADYLDYLASELEYADALDTVPIGRYNVAPVRCATTMEAMF